MASSQIVVHVKTPSRLVSVLQHFPPVTFAFAYGSGAHHQPGLYECADFSASATTVPLPEAEPAQPIGQPNTSGRKGPVIDFIFAVKDAHGWHHENLSRNPGHYSWVGRLGTSAVCGISEAVGVGVHFNTLVSLDEQMTIKYGIIEEDDLERDLALWEHLYVSGRMHKPITALMTAPEALVSAQQANLNNAMAAALMLLPPTFTEMDLLRMLVGLSYCGDVRLLVGAEDPHKVSRIVNGSWNELYGMYLPVLEQLSKRVPELELQVVELGLKPGSDRSGRPPPREYALWRQSKAPEAQEAVLRLLAPGLLQHMANRLEYDVPVEHLVFGTTTQRDVVAAVLRAGAPQRMVANSLASIVRRSSIYQAAAGLFAAGGGKAVQYVGAKMAKAVRPLLAAAAATVASGPARSQRKST